MSSLTSSAPPAFQQHSIVPDVFPSLPHDVDTLDVRYAGKSVYPGQNLERDYTLEVPEISWSGAKAGDYVVVMVDPDLFQRNDPTGQVRHWLAVVSGSPDAPLRIQRDISSYLQCSPAAGTGEHRYTFALLRKPTAEAGPDIGEGWTTKNAPNEDLKDRMGFHVDRFAADKGLEVVAVNFMLVGPNVKSTAANLATGAQALVDKALGM